MVEANNEPVGDNVGRFTLGAVWAVLELSDTFFTATFALFWYMDQ